jgi:hypothetical protein
MKRGRPILNPWVLWTALIVGITLAYIDGCRNGRPKTFEEKIIKSEELRRS